MSTTILDIRKDLPVHATRKWERRSLTDILYITLHHQAGTGPIENVARYHIGPNHISKKGCPGFCYHYHIAFDGTISWTNDLETITWSSGNVKSYRFPSRIQLKKGASANEQSIAIMLQGDFDGEGYKGYNGDPESAQMEAVLRLRFYLLSHLNLAPEMLLGHCHVNKRNCPGFTAQSFIEKLWNEPANLYIPEPQEMSDTLSMLSNTIRLKGGN
jgi:hypothetical protein